MKKIYTIIFTIFVYCGLCSASPSIDGISGVGQQNSTLVISGQQFGTKSTAQPTEWETFSDGLTNTSADIGTWSDIHSLTVTGCVRGVNSNYAGTLNFTGILSAICTSNDSILSNKWFVSYWFYLANDWDWGSTGEGGGDGMLSNVKFFRIWNPSEVVYENFVMATDLYLGDDMAIAGVENTATSYTYDIDFPLKTNWTKGTWHNLKFQYGENSSVGASDGTIKCWRDGVLIINRSNLITREDEDLLKRPHIGFYNSWSDGAGNNNAPNGFFMSDIYCDASWSRVEIGNNQTYSLCTHTEMQIPQTWSDGSISIIIKNGSFSSGDRGYLFVIDADGNASAGWDLGTLQADGTWGNLKPVQATNLTMSNVTVGE